MYLCIENEFTQFYFMKKYILDLVVTQNIKLHDNYVLIKLTHANPLPEMLPGQFAEIRIDGSNTTFLRRPISINYVDKTTNEVWFLVQLVGDGTRKLATVKQGDIVNVVMPLGNGFTMPRNVTKVKPLLVGGGVGTAPMLMLGAELVKMGCTPAFLLGARSSKDLLQLENFEKLGEVYTTTEDGSMGEKGYVTQHSVLHTDRFDMIYTCGPKPMMVSVAKYAKAHGIECEVSLENRMACGVGACLCCVENTDEGHTGRYSTVQAAYRTPVFFKKRRTPGESVRDRRPGRTSSPSRKNPVAVKKNGTASRASVFSAKSAAAEKDASGAVWMHTTSSAAATRKRSTAGYPRRAVIPRPTR